MPFAELRFKKQRSIEIALVHIIQFTSVSGILIMQGSLQNQGKIRILFFIENISILGEGFVTVCLNTYFV